MHGFRPAVSPGRNAARQSPQARYVRPGGKKRSAFGADMLCSSPHFWRQPSSPGTGPLLGTSRLRAHCSTSSVP